MRAIIVAAGKGERLYPLTKNTPKPLLHVKGGPTLLDCQLKALKNASDKNLEINRRNWFMTLCGSHCAA